MGDVWSNINDQDGEGELLGCILQLAFYCIIKPICYLLYYTAKGSINAATWLYKKAVGGKKTAAENQKTNIKEKTKVNIKETSLVGGKSKAELIKDRLQDGVQGTNANNTILSKSKIKQQDNNSRSV